MRDYDCDHAIIIGPAFPTSDGSNSALGKFIAEYRRMSKSDGTNRTITLMTVNDLAKL